MLEENGETYWCVPGVTDVDPVTFLVVLTRISDVEFACCVGCSCLFCTWSDLCLDLASKWCKGVCIVVMFTPYVRIC